MVRIIRGTRVVPAVVVDACEAARLIRDGAHAAVEAACAEGRANGFEAGREDGLARTTEVVARAHAAAARRLEEQEPALTRLAVRIAERILGRELALAPEGVVDIVRAAVAAARAQHTLVVRVHPDDQAAVEAVREELLAQQAFGATLVVSADATIPQGGCVIDTEVGTVDARLEVQLAAIERALLEPAS